MSSNVTPRGAVLPLAYASKVICRVRVRIRIRIRVKVRVRFRVRPQIPYVRISFFVLAIVCGTSSTLRLLFSWPFCLTERSS